MLMSGRRLGLSRVGVVTWALVAGAVVLGVVVPVVLATATGGLEIPHNDAWAYSRIGQEFGRSGQVRLLGWNRASLVGQFVVLGPLASSLVAQQLFVALLASTALLACFDLLVASVGWRRAGFGVLLVAVWPGFGLLATSFMGDVPAFAATVGSLALGRRALVSGSRLMLVASLLVGVWGVTVREQVAAAPVAVLVAAWVAARRGEVFRERFLAGLGSVAVVGVVVFEWWRRSLPAGDPPQVGSGGLSAGAEVAVHSFLLLALVLFPAVVLLARPWAQSRAAWAASGAVAVVALVCWRAHWPSGAFPGNYLDRLGPYRAVAVGQREVLPQWLWSGLSMVAVVSAVLLAGLLVDRLRRLDVLLGGFLVLAVTGTLVQGMSGQDVFDRYLLEFLPPLLAAVLAAAPAVAERTAWRPWARRVGAAAAALSLAAASLALTGNGLAFDTARWQAARQATAEGVPARLVDAGLEWDGYHSPRGIVPAYTPRHGVFGWYERMYPPASTPCVLVLAQPRRVSGWHLRHVRSYRRYAVFGRSRLWVYSSACRRAAVSGRQ